MALSIDTQAQRYQSTIHGYKDSAIVISLLAVSVAWFLVLSLSGSLTPQPFVFWDEAGYFLPILHGYNSENYKQWSIVPPYPAYLYYVLYSLLPTENMHANVKILNAFFISASALPAYAVARQYLKAPLAAAFALMTLVSPISTLGRYVMVEPLYFFGFWVSVWVILTSLKRSMLLAALAGGISIGVLSLIKPHALALLAGLGFFFLIRGGSRSMGALAALLQFIVYYSVHVTLGGLLTGHWLWTFSGDFYSGTVPGLNIGAAVFNLCGHMLAIAMLVSIPLTITVSFIFYYRLSNGAWERNLLGVKDIRANDLPTLVVPDLHDLGLLACCLLTSMVAMTVIFSQGVYSVDPAGEPITNLHGRYYFYALPLFVLAALGMWQNDIQLSKLIPISAIAVLVSAMAIERVGLHWYCVGGCGNVHFPDLALFNGPSSLALALLPLILLVILRKLRARPAVLIVILSLWYPLLGIMTTAKLSVINPLLKVETPNNFDTLFLNNSDLPLRALIGRPDGMVLGTAEDSVLVYRAMFYLRSMSAGRILSAASEVNNPGFTNYEYLMSSARQPKGPLEIHDNDFPSNVRWAILLPSVVYAGRSPVTDYGPLKVVWRN